MKVLEKISGSPEIHKALNELRQKLFARFDVEKLILYGSVARGEADDESDIDLLVITRHPLTRFRRHEITDLVFDINLQYGTNFSTLVIDRKSWETGMFSILPLREEILKDGMMI